MIILFSSAEINKILGQKFSAVCLDIYTSDIWVIFKPMYDHGNLHTEFFRNNSRFVKQHYRFYKQICGGFYV